MTDQRHLALAVVDQRREVNSRCSVFPLTAHNVQKLYDAEPDLKTGGLPELVADERLRFVFVLIYHTAQGTMRRKLAATSKPWVEGDETAVLNALAQQLGIRITRTLTPHQGGLA